jgi:hypothetical protein
MKNMVHSQNILTTDYTDCWDFFVVPLINISILYV